LNHEVAEKDVKKRESTEKDGKNTQRSGVLHPAGTARR